MNASSFSSTIASTGHPGRPLLSSLVGFLKFAESRETSQAVSIQTAVSVVDVMEQTESIPSVPQVQQVPVQPTRSLSIANKTVRVTNSCSFEKRMTEKHKKDGAEHKHCSRCRDFYFHLGVLLKLPAHKYRWSVWATPPTPSWKTRLRD